MHPGHCCRAWLSWSWLGGAVWASVHRAMPKLIKRILGVDKWMRGGRKATGRARYAPLDRWPRELIHFGAINLTRESRVSRAASRCRAPNPDPARMPLASPQTARRRASACDPATSHGITSTSQRDQIRAHDEAGGLGKELHLGVPQCRRWLAVQELDGRKLVGIGPVRLRPGCRASRQNLLHL